MNRHFLSALTQFLHYKFRLLLAGFFALLSAGCFGVGLGSILPAFTLLLDQDLRLPDLIRASAARMPLAESGVQWANQLAELAPADTFLAFLLVMSAIVGMQLASGLFRFLYQIEVDSIIVRVMADWRERLFRHLVSVPLLQLRALGSGRGINYLVTDLNTLARGFRSFIAKSSPRMLRLVVSLAVAFAIAPMFALLATLAAPAVLMFIRRMGKPIRKGARKALTESGEMITTLQEALLGIQLVKVHGPRHALQEFRESSERLVSRQQEVRRAKAFAAATLDSFYVTAVVGVACLLAWQVLRQGTPVASLIASLVALIAAARTLASLTASWHTLSESSAAAERLQQLFQIPEEPATGGQSVARHRKDIVFDEVSFRYPERSSPALVDINLVIRHGEMVALVGPNGAGKTTLLSLLPRLLEPDEGRILIDRVDCAGADLTSLRSQIALVPQETVLFHGTIGENIRYGLDDRDEADIVEAARLAGAHEFISLLPDGYSTSVQELGANLSAGQRQRIAIARAILRDPAILILDEPTSQADQESEELIVRALQRLRGERTVLVSAHRLSTVLQADLAVVLDRGRIVSVGDPETVLKDGTYLNVQSIETGRPTMV